MQTFFSKKYKKMIWWGLTLVMFFWGGFLTLIPVQADDPDPNPDACFEFSSGTITDYNAGEVCGVDVVIPASISGTEVVAIGQWAFAAKALKTVIIPDTVKTIGFEAFTRNELESVIFGTGLEEIGDRAFTRNRLTGIVLPESLQDLGRGAFTNNQFPDEHAFISAISRGEKDSSHLNSYAGAKKMEVAIPDTFTTIGDFAFAWGDLAGTIEIPDSVSSIGEGAFYHNELSGVIFSDIPVGNRSELFIGASAFEVNLLESVLLPDHLSYVGMSGFANNSPARSGGKVRGWYNNLNIENLEWSPENAFLILEKLPTPEECFEFQDGVVLDYNNQLPNCSNQIRIPDQLSGETVTAIGTGAFSDKGLNSVIIPDSVSSIGLGAFQGNYLSSISIPDSVTFIGGGAFNKNYFQGEDAFIYARTITGEDTSILVSFGGIRNIYLPDQVTTIGDYALVGLGLGSPRGRSIDLGHTLTTIGTGAFQENEFESILLPTSLTHVYSGAFVNNLGKSEYGNKVVGYIYGKDPEEISSSDENLTIFRLNATPERCFEFYGGTIYGYAQDASSECKTPNLTIPEKINDIPVVSIEGQAFMHEEEIGGLPSSALQSLTLPNTLTYIGTNAFSYNDLTGVIIPNAVEVIGGEAFKSNKIVSLTLGIGVESIGFQAFHHNLLTNLDIPATVTNLGWGAFTDNQLPEEQAFVYARTETGIDTTTLNSYGGANRTGVIIPNISKIGEFAFEGTDLASVTIPETVNEIGNYAFSLNKLTSIDLPYGLTSIKDGTFISNLLTGVHLPTTVSSIGAYAFSYNLGKEPGSSNILGTTYNNPGSIFVSSEASIELEWLETPEECFDFDSGTQTITDYVVGSGQNCGIDVFIPKTIVGTPVTKIADRAFYDKGLRSVRFPTTGLQSIGDWAFAKNQLSSLEIPSSITHIGIAAFNDNKLPSDQAFVYKRMDLSIESVGLDAIDMQTIVSYGGSIKTGIVLPGWVDTIEAYAFAENGIFSLTIPNAIQSIGAYAFKNNLLEEIKITGRSTPEGSPLGIENLAKGVFENNQLTKVFFSNGISTIGEDAFSGNQLVSLLLPSTITTIASGAFAANPGDPSHENKVVGFSYADTGSITVAPGANIELVGIDATPDRCFTFSNNSITDYEISCGREVVIPESIAGSGVMEIGAGTFSKKNIESITFPNSIISIAQQAFDDNNLSVVNLSNLTGLIYIGDNAFSSNQITDLSLPASLSEIGNAAFADNHISTLTLPSALTYLGDYAFLDNMLHSLTIPASLTTLREGVFENNDLGSVSFLGGVTTIGTGAFKKNNLQSIDLPDTLTHIYDDAFAENSGTGSGGKVAGTIKKRPAGVFVDPTAHIELIRGFTDEWCFISETGVITEYLVGVGCGTEVNIPSEISPYSVIAIGSGAFANKGLTYVQIPNSVQSIGTGAFQHNTLSEISIPSLVTFMGAGAFNHNQLPSNQAFIYARTAPGVDTTTHLVSYGGHTGNAITIPVGVSHIGEGTFQNMQIPSVTFSTGLLEIATHAFQGNLLSTLNLPNSVITIGTGAFQNNTISGINFGTMLRDIAPEAFKDNGLQSIVLPNSIEFIGDESFQNNPGKSAFSGQVEALVMKDLDTITLGLDTNLHLSRGFILSFETNGGSPIAQQVVISGSVLTGLGTPTRSGYTFEGWFSDSGLTESFDFLNPIIEDTILYAKWKLAVSYTVTFNSNGGSSIVSQTIIHGGKVDKPTNPTRSNYTFEGWYKESALSTLWNFDTDTVGSNLILYAKRKSSGSGGGSGGSGGGSGGSSGGSNPSGTPSTTTGTTQTITGSVNPIASGQDLSKTTESQQSEIKTLPNLIQEYMLTYANSAQRMKDLSTVLQSTETSTATQELKDAYVYAYLRGITTLETIEKARLTEPLTRAAMAKMMSVFAVKVLGKTPIKSETPSYADLDGIGEDLPGYIQLAYQLQIMGIDANGNALQNFNPHRYVTRAEFATVLSRILYGNKYNYSGDDYARLHLNALQAVNILKNTTASMQELRGWVMLMLMRTEGIE